MNNTSLSTLPFETSNHTSKSTKSNTIRVATRTKRKIIVSPYLSDEETDMHDNKSVHTKYSPSENNKDTTDYDTFFSRRSEQHITHPPESGKKPMIVSTVRVLKSLPKNQTHNNTNTVSHLISNQLYSVLYKLDSTIAGFEHIQNYLLSRELVLRHRSNILDIMMQRFTSWQININNEYTEMNKLALLFRGYIQEDIPFIIKQLGSKHQVVTLKLLTMTVDHLLISCIIRCMFNRYQEHGVTGLLSYVENALINISVPLDVSVKHHTCELQGVKGLFTPDTMSTQQSDIYVIDQGLIMYSGQVQQVGLVTMSEVMVNPRYKFIKALRDSSPWIYYEDKLNADIDEITRFIYEHITDTHFKNILRSLRVTIGDMVLLSPY